MRKYSCPNIHKLPYQTIKTTRKRWQQTILNTEEEQITNVRESTEEDLFTSVVIIGQSIHGKGPYN